MISEKICFTDLIFQNISIIKVAVKPNLECMDELLLFLKNLINFENFKCDMHLFIYNGFCTALHTQKLYCVWGSVVLVNPGQNEWNLIPAGNNKVQYLQKTHYIKY